ncbi:DUF305 domain-containing protein [Nocardia implantans]|uniref:DUF305 domain-containing protein n=1 Tax=Nocardia implantans TaxID=3108168 RepID=A0ABU6B117_9NOCA|nr:MULTISPECIES: DUF305 domain-containing protein [unclassified Nocardia]MBF6195436.1 DUF305 domain-containing protein [Nocardia beijingensis]MEA3532054.1 DUF305 domain-containing protein [Nocardia sp. CDC192]MEB3513356.1 DUF305 domain-containing protein [Nocardia sp. CDC186]
MFITRTRSALALAAVAAVSLAGCGDADTGHTTEHGPSTTTSAVTTTPAHAEHNDADVMFLQMMYPHHAQAVEMARLVPSHTDNQQLRALATQIEQAQAPEMQQITTLLQSFGQPAPTATEGHGGHDMPGMMSAEQMAALGAASGPDFDRQWLTMMIEHHAGAITMAETELAQGENADAKALAERIIAAQRAEINQMRAMLGQS